MQQLTIWLAALPLLSTSATGSPLTLTCSLRKASKECLKKTVLACGLPSHVIVEKTDQIHFIINGMKLTFFRFHFSIVAAINYGSYFRMPDLLTPGAMKAFALGGRGKWKDYVDLYFIIKQWHTIREILDKAKEIFTVYLTRFFL